jgi:uncharacterized protein (PEP-CTERM system associated)
MPPEAAPAARFLAMTLPGNPRAALFRLHGHFRLAQVGVAAALLFGAAAAQAQLSGWTVTPTFTASQEFTDNRNLSATDRQSDAITTLGVGLRMGSRAGRVQGSVSYSLSADFYARDSSYNTIYNSLSANMAAELVEQVVFFDASASISQQSVSAFGLQGNRPGSVNDNSTEYGSLTLSPYVRGRPFGLMDLEARLSSTYSGALDGSTGSAGSHFASVRVGENLGAIGWAVVASRSYDDFENFEGGRTNVSDRITPFISYTPEPGLRFFLSGGYERNDVLSVQPTTYKTWGGGFSWQPSPRTQFSAQTEQRYFGNSWNISASHRMRRAVVAYTDTNSDENRTTGSGAPLSTYDLFFAQFASIQPDPALREVLVRDFLRAAGLDPDQQASAGFINKAVTVTRNQNLSLAVQGQRNTLVLSAFATSSRRVDTLSQAEDDLSQVSRLTQQGVSISMSHRLTPTSSVVVFASAQRTPDQDDVQGNDLGELSLTWSDRIGPRSGVSVTGRHTRATGANPYRENSLLARFNYAF